MRHGLAAALLAAFLTAPVASHAQAPPRILVMPFENVTRDSRIFWLTEAAAVLLADNLNALGAGAITREERRAAFERLQVPPASVLTDATVIRIGQLVGASHVVVGSLQLQGDTLLVRAKSIALEAARIQLNVTDGGPLPELFSMFDRLARQLAPEGTRAATVEIENPPLRAFENYIKGLLAETPGTAINYLNAALEANPAFVRPRLALWDVYTDQGEHERALGAVKGVPSTARFGRRAAFLAGLSRLSLKRLDEAFDSFNALLKERPTAAVYNNLGIVQLRRGASAQSSGLPTYFFSKAAEVASPDADYFFNLGYAYLLERDAQAAIYWLREAVRRDPTDGDAHLVLAAALSSTGQAVEANRERELARRLSSKYDDIDRRSAPDAVPPGLERLKSDVELPYAVGIAELAASGQREHRELARFHLASGQRLFDQERDRDALQDLNRALFLSPYEAQAHLLVGRIHLRTGRVREAIDALKIALWSEETADAHAWLGEAYLEARDLPAARAEAERALALEPGHEHARRVIERSK
jgi:tetratricopeptide (TPR) repeat protein